MTVLGLDCAGKTAGVAVCQDEQLVYESRLCAGFTHSETLLCLCKEALRACRLCVQKLSLLAVTAGPGSFTGLRIALPWQRASLSRMISPAPASLRWRALPSAPRRQEAACARWTPAGARCTMRPLPWARRGPRRLWPDGHGPAAALTEQILRLPRPLWLLGDGAGLVLGAAWRQPAGYIPAGRGRALRRGAGCVPRRAARTAAKRAGPCPVLPAPLAGRARTRRKAGPARACEHLHGKEVFV